MIADKSVLITGGTGSFGHEFVKYILSNDRPRKVIIYSRDEYKQNQMLQDYGYWKGKLRFFLGDVRDIERLKLAFKDVDIVIHAAALKRVESGEYNPAEVIQTNVDGTYNVIKAAIDSDVEKVIYLSTDKAVNAENFYGCTKAASEKLILASNMYAPKFNVVRYGNVMGSRGGVLEKFLGMRDLGNNIFPLTHPDCTRFWVDFKDAIHLCMKAIEEKPGTILVSKTNSFKIKDLIKAIYLRAEIKEVGLGSGEKIHETLITNREVSHTKKLNDCYRILPCTVYCDSIIYDNQHGEEIKKQICSGDDEYLKPLEWVRAKLQEYKKTQEGAV